jgi:Tfp pilus assembly protein PilX
MKAILKNNDGIALPIVVVIIAIISLLGFTAVFLTESQTSMGGHHEKSETTLSIAEAGVNKYLWHLNKDSKFYETTEGQNFVEDSEGNLIVHSFQNGKYTLEIEEPTTSQPVVKIKSTGWLNADESVKTAIEVRVHKRGFTQYVHLCEDMVSSNGSVYWGDGEQLYGPVHTNGYLRTMGSPTFHDRVTYTKGIRPYSGVDRADYRKIGSPEKVAPLVFPTTNDQLKEWADPGRGGYTFEGRTCIYLNGSTLKIRNPNVNNGDTITLSLPASGVIYVGSGDKSWPRGTEVSGKWGLNSGNVFISGTLDGRLTIAAAQDIYITGSDPTDYNNPCIPSQTNYNNAGIFYANTNINSSDNLSDDMLGLIANENVRILHYYWPSKNGYNNIRKDVAPGGGITIYAAIFSITKSYGYEKYDEGDNKGYIYFYGSLTQSSMCATYSNSYYGQIRGYRENNTHDPRLLYDTPPHFLDPENAGWEIVSWKRVTP